MSLCNSTLRNLYQIANCELRCHFSIYLPSTAGFVKRSNSFIRRYSQTRRFTTAAVHKSYQRHADEPWVTGEETPMQMKDVRIRRDQNIIEIVWRSNTNKCLLFPYVWLRDHCQCQECFHPISKSRTMLFDDLQLDVCPVDLKYDNSFVEIKWSDGHVSSYESEWLFRRGFEEDGTISSKRPFTYKLPKIYWDSSLIQDLPTANFGELMTDDGALLTWLRHLEIYGFALINNAPAEEGQVKQLVERVTFVKKTHYGEEFSVKAKPDPSNVAYSSGPLQMHTDLPYYEYKPGLQLIHCIVQFEGDGAESQIADAQHVARELERIHPHLFNVLSSTSVDWCDIGTDEKREFFKVFRNPVICIGPDGSISRINFSHPQRDSFFNVDVGTVIKWYTAMKTFHDMLKDPQYCLQFKMLPGTIQSFDNLRIVHGRRSYPEGIGNREIEGCYLDWDEARSMRRVLELKINSSS